MGERQGRPTYALIKRLARDSSGGERSEGGGADNEELHLGGIWREDW